MSVITLDDKEREKFALYLKQEAETNAGMAQQMETLKDNEAMVLIIKSYRMKAVACNLIAGDLLRTEDMKL